LTTNSNSTISVLTTIPTSSTYSKESNITKDFNKKEERYILDLKLNISEGYIGILISKIL